MAPRLTVTESELLAALRQMNPASHDGPADAHTIHELARIMDLDERLVRRRMLAIFEAGGLEVVWVRRPGMDGRRCKVPAYRLRAAGTGG